MNRNIIKYFIAIGITIIASNQESYSQSWNWVKGPNNYTPNVNGLPIYGTQGVPALSNYPGARSGAISWINNTDVWLFGGSGIVNTNQGVSTFLRVHNDIWKYNTITNQWVWLKGSDTMNAQFFGTAVVGQEFSNTNLGARKDVASWRDSNGNIWVYGGYGIGLVNCQGLLSDLWKFNIQTNNWSYRKGNRGCNASGNYGTVLIPAASNAPQATSNSITTVDNNGVFWMFGGRGWNSTSNSPSNDYGSLWKYDTLTNYWTFMRGPYGNVNQVGKYSVGFSPLVNQPGCRHGGVAWTDSIGNIYILGGKGWGYTWDGYQDNGYLNDLWKYNPINYQWTFIKGDSITNQLGVYGTKGVASNNSKPGGRSGAISWKDAEGNFWLFGGYGYSSIYTSLGNVVGYLNDLWRYNPSSNQWTWMSGDTTYNQYGNYGSLNVANPNNKPGSRSDATITLCPPSSKIYLYGGSGYAGSGDLSAMGDLWSLHEPSYVWMGLASTDWTVASNWSGNEVPGADGDVIIPSGTPYSPMIPNGITVFCRTLTIRAGAVVNVGANAHINVMH